jgi:multidrug efflux system membrane fusion protein
VLTGQQGTYVYTIDTASNARQRAVQISRTVDSVAVIATGLKEGEQVIVDGQSRLIPGSKVAIKGAAR